MKLLILYLALAVLLPNAAAQDCKSPEYALLHYIIKEQNIRYLAKEASPAPLLCEYTEAANTSKYKNFTESVLTFNGDAFIDKQAIVSGINSLRFKTFLEDNAAYEWDAACVPAIGQLLDPGETKRTAAPAFFISKPLLTEDLQYAIVYIRKSNGQPAGGTGFINVYRKDNSGGWQFYAHGGCMTYR
ncbi:hypothetical protein [Pontibacter flavimaris]|uniref:Nuclear transport factor 2 family protein n=1 Tax=Pontibacter flavimaris TaxID=1797110 RepID=A0A1Q5PI50_9BACT|nr:hypothetical protein [Pontibacter flavimaris]OKL41899.1 hypothetical protein A3841_07760 [Pontibacter flavimaris]